MTINNDAQLSPAELTVRAYAQWIEITVFVVNSDFEVNNAYLDWGKFYAQGNKDKEISPSQINGTIIKDSEQYVISSCGRENSPSGTEGGFSVYDGDKLVFKYSWDCPWSGSNHESLDIKDSENYTVKKSGGGSPGGAIGNVFITVVKKS